MNLSPIKRRSVLQGMAALGSTGLLGTALAQTGKAAWPTKPIRLVVPFNAGGATDIIARTVGEALSKRIGQPVVVDNKGGAAGILGTDAVAKAAGRWPHLAADAQYLDADQPVSVYQAALQPAKGPGTDHPGGRGAVTLVVHPSVPANNMKELLAYVKAQKGKLSYGSWGTGSYAHLAGAYMSKTTDSDMVHVAYKGEAPMIQELIGGQLQLCFSSALNTKPFIDSGRVKAIGVTGKQRMDILPKVPTIFEQGVQDDAYSIFGWVAMGAPAGIPKEIVDQLSAHLREVAKDPKVVERIAAAGFLPMMNSPQEFQQNYQRDMPIWKALVEAAGARLD
jgi:Uncharacterized protein conserved in bacteria